MRGASPIEPQLLTGTATEAALKTCSLACKAVVAHYLNDDEAGESEFGRCLLRAAAAIEAAATPSTPTQTNAAPRSRSPRRSAVSQRPSAVAQDSTRSCSRLQQPASGRPRSANAVADYASRARI